MVALLIFWGAMALWAISNEVVRRMQPVLPSASDLQEAVREYHRRQRGVRTRSDASFARQLTSFEADQRLRARRNRPAVVAILGPLDSVFLGTNP
jgi:hypothetical protein